MVKVKEDKIVQLEKDNLFLQEQCQVLEIEVRVFFFLSFFETKHV